jgi:hypothetical protein
MTGFSVGLSGTLSQTQSTLLLTVAGAFNKGLAQANNPALMSKIKLNR